MKKQFKRNLSILLSLAILISALSGIGITASAESQITENDLTGTTVASEVTLSPSDFKNINTVISENKYTGSGLSLPIGSTNTFEVKSTGTDVVLTLTLPSYQDNYNEIGGKDFTTLTAEGLKIKSYSYEYVGTLKSLQAQPAVLKVTGGTKYVGSYISPMRYSADGFAKYVINNFTETDGVPVITEGAVYSVSASSFDWNNTYNFKVDVEYTYDEEGACRGVTVTYNYRNKDDCSTEKMPSPVSQTIDFTSGFIAGSDPGLAARGIEAVEPVIALRLGLGRTTNHKLISTYSNLAVVAEQTTDYTQDVLSFVNGNPIVIDIKNDATADFSERGEEAKAAKAAFAKLDETTQNIVKNNGYYNEAKINEIIASIGNIKANDLTAGTTAVKNIDLKANQLSYRDIVSEGSLKLYSQFKITMGKNGNSYNSSTDDNSLKLTLNANKADYGGDITNFSSGIDGTAITFADAENTKIKSFSYIFKGTLSGTYGKPVILKGDDGKLIAPGFDYGPAVPTPNSPNFKVYTQSTEEGVTKISNTATSLQLAYLSNVANIKQTDEHTYTVKVEYNYDEGDVCTGANVTYTCTVEETEYSFGMSIKLTGAMNHNSKDVSISGVDSAITQITPCIGFRMANFATVNGVAQSTYSNVNVNADQTVDYTNDILNFVNANKVLIDIKNGLDCSLRKDEVAAAKAAYEALTDDNLKNLIAANGYYNAEAIENIIAVSAEEIANELNGTVTMAGASVKMNQIDNNNQLRFAADYTAFNAIVEKYSDRVNIVKHRIYALAGSKTADVVIKTGTSFETTVSNFTTVTEDGTDKLYDYWIIGGTANYVSTKVSVVAYTTITIDNTEYTLYSDAISRSIVSVIRAILNAQEKTAVESARATVNTNGNTEYTYDDLMTNKVGTNTDKQAFVKAVFTQFCKDNGYI